MAGFLIAGLPWPALAAPAGAHPSPRSTAIEAVHQAQHEVDAAWDAFHSAAVGGTLASPETQVHIERALHDARRLLIQARQVAARGEPERLEPLLLTIHRLSALAVSASQEPKP
jgi:hypothetical protein